MRHWPRMRELFASGVGVTAGGLLALTIILPAHDAQAQQRRASKSEARAVGAASDGRKAGRNGAAVRSARRIAAQVAAIGTLPEPARPAPAAARASRMQVPSTPPEPLVAVISLGSQRMTVYAPSGPIMQSAISSGQTGYRTPTGVFSILQRNRHHESNIYSGAPMPYMQRLTWSGIALHEGVVPGYPASHGCIRLPSGSASQLWGTGRIGMRVVVAPTDVQPETIAHPRLPVPQLTPVSASELPSAIKLAAAGAEASAERLLDPFRLAQARKLKAAAEREAAERAVRPALDEAAHKSAAANQAAEHIKSLAEALAQAEEDLEEKREAIGRQQTMSDDDPTVDALKAAQKEVELLEEEIASARAAEKTISNAAFAAARVAREAELAVAEKTEAQKIASFGVEPVSVFVSLKESRVYVRQGFNPVYDEPVQIAEPSRPLGTHVFTAIESVDGGAGLRWVAVTVTNSAADGERTEGDRVRRRGGAQAERMSLPASEATGVLDRFELPEATRKLISDRLWPGASLIVSDHGLGTETGKGTDFIVLTK